VPPGDLVRTPYGPRRVLDWQATGEKPTLALRLSNGAVLRCSPEHRVRSLGRWVHPADLKPGDPVYLTFREGMFGSEVGLNLSRSTPYETRKTPPLPDHWTVELAELVGYLMADGHIARSNYNHKPSKDVLAFGWDDQELIDRLAETIRRTFAKEPVHRITRTCPVLEVSSVDVASAFEQLGAGGKSGVIRVPRGLFTAPE